MAVKKSTAVRVTPVIAVPATLLATTATLPSIAPIVETCPANLLLTANQTDELSSKDGHFRGLLRLLQTKIFLSIIL